VFHTASGDVTTEFMHQSGTNTYYWGENFGAISRRLENSGEMLLILPDEDVTAESLLADKEVMDFVYDHYSWENNKFLIVNQSVPKFDVSSDYSLISGLKKLGVTDVFDGGKSDFTPLLAEEAVGMEVEVSEATHAARVAIDEKGCVAAAFTVMLACGAARPPEEKIDFVLDRPFLFVISGQDGQPLFIGIVNQPK
jgi:serine protease inhibitor